LSTSSSLSWSNNSAKHHQNNLKKCEKEKKLKEITRLCLNHSSNYHHQQRSGGTESATAVFFDSLSFPEQQQLQQQNSTTGCCETMTTTIMESSTDLLINGTETRFLFAHLAREFFLDCRQRLDNDTFVRLLNTIIRTQSSSADADCCSSFLDDIYKLIKHDQNLLNKFSAFLTCEKALYYDLLTQACQYEKCFDFFHKLELLIPNKLTFKKLLQSIISNCNFSSETGTVFTKLEEIKSKLKSIGKNNSFMNFELEYLFDQRYANLEPIYESLSLVNVDQNQQQSSGGGTAGDQAATTSAVLMEPQTSDESVIDKRRLNQEFIDLSNEYPLDYGTKRCSCSCHSSNNPNQQQQQQSSNQQQEDTMANINNQHCLLCSLKFIKGKLCIKCEGKKAVPLIYKIQ
jgi:hypothetical protein